MSDILDLGRWQEFLPIVEIAVNLLLNKSIRYSTFFLVHKHHPMLPIELLKGDESAKLETLLNFLERTQEVWHQARAQMEKTIAI